ncbi:MAG: hypothetical protein ACE3L7_07325 [Candidatus Pristimantibacillus sp.]
MDKKQESTSREKLKAYGFSKVVLATMTDEECDQMIKTVMFI